MSDFYYLNIQRGNKNLIHNSYIYNKDKVSQDGIKWRFLQRTCKGAVSLSSEGEFSMLCEHNHSNEAKKIQSLKMMSMLKEKALTTRDRRKELITQFTSILDDERLKNLPCIKSLGNQVTKIRNKNFEHFESKEDYDIPEFLVNNFRKEKFLVFDSGCKDDERYIVFMSKFDENWLNKANTWLIDGTFYSAPKNYTQILTVHGYLFGKSLPLVYILSKSKKQSNYEKIFNKLKTYIRCDPTTICVDFEKGLINALSSVFKVSKISGCLFHFGQSVWRKLQECGLSNEYNKNKQFKKFIRKHLNLAFVPVGCLEKEYLKVSNCFTVAANLTENFENFKNFFIKTYIKNNKNKNIYNNAIYDHSFWSVNENILKNIPRTTCTIEAWHRVLNNSTLYPHPNLAKFVEMIQNEEEITRVKIIQELNGSFFFKQGLRKRR
jgi:hypothetical protein